MRTTLFDPMPDEVRALDPRRRREISRTVRSGGQVENRRDARAAVAMAVWMERQLGTTYVDLLTSRISLIAAAALLVLGFLQTRSPVLAAVNLVPYLAIMLLVRVGARWLFRNAPESLEKNRLMLRRNR